MDKNLPSTEMYLLDALTLETCLPNGEDLVKILEKWVPVKEIYSYEYNGIKEEVEDTSFDENFYIILKGDGRLEIWEDGEKQEGNYSIDIEGKMLRTTMANSDYVNNQIKILTSSTMEVYEEGEYDDAEGDTFNLYKYKSVLTLKRA